VKGFAAIRQYIFRRSKKRAPDTFHVQGLELINSWFVPAHSAVWADVTVVSAGAAVVVVLAGAMLPSSSRRRTD